MTDYDDGYNDGYYHSREVERTRQKAKGEIVEIECVSAHFGANNRGVLCRVNPVPKWLTFNSSHKVRLIVEEETS